MPMPSKRTPDLEVSILERLADGEPLAEICRDEGMPDPGTWRDWCHADENLAIAYARARELGEEAIAAECLAISDDGRNDWMEKRDKDGALIGWQINGEHVQRSKLRVDTRLKLLAKWNPKKWGEKVDVTSDGERLAPDLSNAAAQVAALLAAARERKAEKG